MGTRILDGGSAALHAATRAVASAERASRVGADGLRAPWGPLVAATGDSKVATNCDRANNLYGDSWLTHLWLASDGDLEAPINGGHGSYTSAQLLAAFDAEIGAYLPDVVIEDMGTNDVLDGSNTPATTVASLAELLAKCQAIGAALVLTTLTPLGTAALGTPSAPTVSVLSTGGTFGTSSPRYRVTAVNGAGETLASSSATATISSGTTNSVKIEAPAVQGATGYKFYRSDDAGSTWGLIGTNSASGASWTPSRVFTDTNIAKGVSVPGSDTTAVALNAAATRKILTINAAKKRFAATHRLPILDFYTLVADPSTGMWQTGYTRDGTHPTPKTSKLLGQLAWSKLSPYFARRTPIGNLYNSDPVNAYPSATPNGLHLSGGGTNPSSWSPTSNPATGATITNAARSGHKGNAHTFVRAAGADTWGTILGGGPWVTVVPGHKYAFQMRSELVGGDSAGAAAAFGFRWRNNVGAPTNAARVSSASDFGPFRFQAVAIAPAGATQVEVFHDFGPGEGTSAISEVWIVDLTALGLD